MTSGGVGRPFLFFFERNPGKQELQEHVIINVTGKTKPKPKQTTQQQKTTTTKETKDKPRNTATQLSLSLGENKVIDAE